MIIFVTLHLSSANAFNLDMTKILSSGNGLKGDTHTLILPCCRAIGRAFALGFRGSGFKSCISNVREL